MPNGRLTRRTTPRLARGFAVLIVVLSAGAGCQRFPLRYSEVTPESTSRPTTRVEHASAPTAPPAELPPLPAIPLADDTDSMPRSTFVSKSSRTPLIDQALKNAETAQVQAVDVSGPESDELAAQTANGPVELPPAHESAPVEKPAETKVVEGPEMKPAAPETKITEAKPINPDKPAAPVDEWRDGLARIRQVALRRAGEPGVEAQAWAIRSRVLDWLAGDGPEPAGETGRVWNSVLATLSTATGAETPDDVALSYHLGAAVEALESYAPLQIASLSFCRKIDGFGHYDPVDSPSVRPGQPLLVYCEMMGLRYESDGDRFRSRLSSRVEVLSADGGEVVWSESLGTAEDVCRRRRRDYFVNYRIVVPAKLAPGSYSLRLAQTDVVSDRSVSAKVPFSVTP